MLTASRNATSKPAAKPALDSSTGGSWRCEPGTGLFVWTIWALLFGIAAIYVIRFGADVPVWDDYAVIPEVTGARPVTLGWLWSQHNEHRIPLTRLILLGIFRLDGADPRPVMLLIVGLLASLAAMLVRAASHARGGYHHADAFLPVALLNLGHHANLLWGFQINHVLSLLLLGTVLALVVRSRGIPSLATLAVAAACVSLMPLCNAGGLAFIPALSFWFWVLAARVFFERGPNGLHALRIVTLSLPALLLLALYFRGYSAPKHHAVPAGAWAALRTTAQFLGMSLGDPGARLWPVSGLVVMVLLLGAVGVLVLSWLRQRGERARIEGIACVLAAVISLALGTGWGRSGEDELAGLQARYTTIAIPALLVIYFVFASYGPRFTRNLVPMLLFTGVCVLLWPNTEEAWAAGRLSRPKPKRSIAIWRQALPCSGWHAGTRRSFTLRKKACTRRSGYSTGRESASSARSETTRFFKSRPSSWRLPSFAWLGGMTATSRSRESTRGSASISLRRCSSAASACGIRTPRRTALPPIFG